MKITLLHGENVKASRDRYFKIIDSIKKRGWEIINLNSSSDELETAISNLGLFSQDRLYIIDGVDNNFKKQIKTLNKKVFDLDINLLIWNEGNVEASLVKIFSKGINEERFDYPKKIFVFLESLRPGNARVFNTLLSEILEHESIELIYYLVSKHFTDLYMAKLGINLPGYQPWRMNKLKNQATSFDEVLLEKIIKKLTHADWKVKNSEADLTLMLDLILNSKLE